MTVSPAASPSRSAAMTLAPSLDMTWLTARPMPRPPPVTSARRPLSILLEVVGYRIKYKGRLLKMDLFAFRERLPLAAVTAP